MAEDWATAVAVLRLAGELIEGIQAGLARRGFDDVRPAHGFAFVRIAAGDATNADVAEHLGITKQSASQLVEQLVTRGYVTRRPAPGDARARLLVLTDRGRACTRAAEEAAAEVVANWRDRIDGPALTAAQEALGRLVRPGPLRMTW